MDWEDIKVAYTVSQTGTVSGAADVLGVHHATVIRHVDRLEGALKQKLFRRHSKGYEPTEAGQSLFNVAAVADEQFKQASAQIKGQSAELSGKIVVTTLPQISRLLMPAFELFRARYPEVRLVIESSMRVFRLEFGEAHLAIRAGKKPQDPDNVVVHLFDVKAALYSSKSYYEAHGRFDEKAPEGHTLVGSSDKDARDPYSRWFQDQGLSGLIGFDSADRDTQLRAILEGLGVGFVDQNQAHLCKNLVQHVPARPEWTAHIWQVTHRDMHRTPKVQAMLECLKECVVNL